MIRPQVSLRNDLLEESGGTEDRHLPLGRVFTHERTEDPGLIGALATHPRRQDSAYKRRVRLCENTRRELTRRVPFDLDLSARDAADHPDAVPTRPPDDGPFHQLLTHCPFFPSASNDADNPERMTVAQQKITRRSPRTDPGSARVGRSCCRRC